MTDNWESSVQVMTDNWEGSVQVRQSFANDGPFSAIDGVDAALESGVVLLSYEDKDDPARGITVGIAPGLGSNMFRFRVGAHEIIHSDPALLKKRDFTGNFVLWPLPNRIRDKRYTYGRQTYSLASVQRPQGNAVLVHGLVFDRPWHYDTPVLRDDGVSVTTYVDMTPESPYYDAYPFDSRLSLTYTLTRDGLSTAYSVHNTGQATLPFGFALHPYFARLSGDDETLIGLPAGAVMEADDQLLPTGRVLRLDGVMYAMFDLREPVPVGHLKLDHVYTDLRSGANAVIDYRRQGLTLLISASDDFTHAVLYAPQGAPYLCVEHQTCSTDAVNLHHEGLQNIAHLLEVDPGATHAGSITYAIRHDAQ